MKPMLSIIVPVYNAIQYLPDCLESIKRQEYAPMEVILVDDGSTDGSGEYCDEFAKADARFKVIHKPNGGLSSARNTGLEYAKGEYITFIDSDDALIGQPYSILLTDERLGCFDIICMNRYASKDKIHDMSYINTPPYKERVYENEEIYSGLCRRTISEAAWDKIYKREIFDVETFTKGTLNEDFLFLIQLLIKRQIKMCVVDYIGYYYYLHAGSITGSGFKKNMVDALYNASFAYENAPTKCKRAATEYFLHKILMFMLNMPKEYIKHNNKDYLFALSKLKEISKKINTTTLSSRDKCLLRMFRRAPMLTKKHIDYIMKKRVKEVIHK